MSYLPVVTPVSNSERIKLLGSVADSFVYVRSSVPSLPFSDVPLTSRCLFDFFPT
jgi:hypothetical protein